MHSRRLRQTIALVSGSLSERVRRVWTHPRLRELYPEFLFATYGVVCASTPILTAAQDEAELRSGTDELSHLLAPYLREHADEEEGHDQWLLDDLEICGIDRSRALHRIPYPSTAALAGTPHFLLRHVHPLAVLGYLAVLEDPASPEFLEGVARNTGIPLGALSTFLRHARLDVTHVAEFDAMLDTLPLTPHHVDILNTAAITAVAQLDAFFADVLDHFSRIDDQALSHTIFTAAIPSQTQGSAALTAASAPVI